MIPRFNKTQNDAVYFGDTRVEIPKLTIRKWEALFETVESLPQLIVNVLAAKGSADFTATLVVAAGMALDETVKIVAAITDLDADFIKDNAGLTELTDFIAKTAQKNDLSAAAKKLQAAFVRFAKTTAVSAQNP
ncbi:hypothetical protein [Paenibacillus sp. YN15]|uniref:hypothetical protein n=1 Tax=Paenibacillus sp. YN15 TaxID=1742774 RepID=UPI000DCEEF56|nr:hypothetical protein [Paenibacillus sp. YN15]RAU96841.1 hypothetical protein DQG13_20010 [Paenibacillus sp. YN15]